MPETETRNRKTRTRRSCWPTAGPLENPRPHGQGVSRRPAADSHDREADERPHLGRHTVPVPAHGEDTVEVAFEPRLPLVSGAEGPSLYLVRPTTTSPAFTSRAASG